MEQKIKKKKKIKLLTIFTAFCDLCIVIFFVVAYGPFPAFKNWFVTTALATGNHKYFANVLYSDEDILQVLKDNTVVESGDSTDASEITFDNSPKETYDSIYEEQILDREEDAVYKLIEIKEKDYSGYMVAIYDASRVELVTSSKIHSGGQQMTAFSKEQKALVAINASGFSRRSGGLVPTGTVIKDGKIKSVGAPNKHGGGLIGFNKDNVLVLTTDSAEKAIKKGMQDAVTFGPFLIVNGKSAEVSGNGGWGYANRTAIAQRKDGIVLFLVIDGRGANGSNGISIADMITLFEKYGAYNAANLDGGGSSVLTINSELINDPRGFGYTGERYLPNAWMVR